MDSFIVNLKNGCGEQTNFLQQQKVNAQSTEMQCQILQLQYVLLKTGFPMVSMYSVCTSPLSHFHFNFPT